MRKLIKVLMVNCFCISVIGVIPAWASMNLEAESSVAGITVAINNYYASSLKPEHDLVMALAANGFLPTAEETEANEVPQVTSTHSAYENVAISRVSNYVNVRSEANTTSSVVGKIYNNCAATILSTTSGEGGEWYQIQSGSVNGYIKAEYFITGTEAESVARQVGKVYATVVNTPSLRLREAPDANSKTLTLLAKGARYVVAEEKNGFVKLAVDSDLEGYVSNDYIKINVEFDKAVSIEEEKAKKAEEARLKKEADDAIKRLEELKKSENKSKQQTAAETTAKKNVSNDAPKSNGNSALTEGPKNTETVSGQPKDTEAPAAETTAASNKKGPGGGSGSSSSTSSEVTSATRSAIVAYAKQFLGNPYVYGGTSLTNGADCSGFTQGVYAHFGISIGRSSRDQAAKGKTIAVSSVQPGDLLFYASGDYINHVAMYIGGGQVIHASTSTTGIIISPSNYRTPAKAVTFLD